MTELTDVYGNDFATQAKRSRADQVVNSIVNNLVNRQLKFRLYDSAELWNMKSKDMKPEIVARIVAKVNSQGQKIRAYPIDKNSPHMNMLPELILNVHVVYLMLIDSEYNRAYFVYITPDEVNAY